MLNQNKVRGLILGGAIGDALGMPVETWTPDKIRTKYPDGVQKYESPDGHKWFTADPNDPDPKKTYMEPGMTTDDTQLTVATMRALTIAGTFCMDEQGKQHVEALRENTAGWGKSTVEAIQRLGNGVGYRESGKTDNKERGTGNGIPMKCSPLAAYRCTAQGHHDESFWQKVVDYCGMSHYTKLSSQAAVVHTSAVIYNLTTDPQDWDVDQWLNHVCNDAFNVFEEGFADNTHLNDTEGNLEHELIFLYENRAEIKTWSLEQIRDRFGGGSCYVLHSLPFTYALYIQNPHSFENLLNIVNAGGDTDTNAKMAGELIGALHGLTFFNMCEDGLVTGLKDHVELLQVADEFCDVYDIPKGS